MRQFNGFRAYLIAPSWKEIINMRLNLELDKAQMDSFKAFQARLGAGSMKELLNNAVTVLEWMADEVAKGNEIVSLNEKSKGYRVLVMPYLQHIAKQERQDKKVEEEATAYAAAI